MSTSDPDSTSTKGPSGAWNNPEVPPTDLTDRGPTRVDHQDTRSYLLPAEHPDELGRLGPYRILRILGEGGMGTVFCANDPGLNRLIALKTLKPHLANHPTAKLRFLREAKSQASVEHDHIIPIYQVGEDNGIPYIAMPLLKGQTLADTLKATRHLPLTEVLRISREIAEGLYAAHQVGLMHRDIKPSNIWLEGERKRVKILDFGLARTQTDAITAQTAITEIGMIVGTPTYMSPEQGRGEDADHRTDIFSLGVIMYQMTAGVLPFRGNSTVGILTSLAIDHPASPRELNPHIPESLNRLIMMMLAKQAKDRPDSTATIISTIQTIEKTIQAQQVGINTVPDRSQWNGIDLELPTETNSQTIAPSVQSTTRRWGFVLVAIVAAIALCWLGYEMTIKTPQGELIVQVDDPEIETRYRDGELKLYDSTGKMLYTLKPTERQKTIPVGDYRLELTGTDGLKVTVPEFKMERDGKVAIRVTLDQSKIAAKTPTPPTQGQNPPSMPVLNDPHREIAKAILQHGGHITVLDRRLTTTVTNIASLPNQPFVVLSFVFQEKPLTATQLSMFEGIRYLRQAQILTNAIRPAETHYFKHTPIGEINWAVNRLTDDVIRSLNNRDDLITLNLSYNQLTNQSIDDMLTMKYLRHLDLDNNLITDEGVIRLSAHRSLRKLAIGPGITGKGLEKLKELRTLQNLDIHGMRDDLVDALAQCKQLRRIKFGSDNQLSKVAVKKLQELLPDAIVEHPNLPLIEAERTRISWALEQKLSLNEGRLNQVPNYFATIHSIDFPIDARGLSMQQLLGMRAIQRLNWRQGPLNGDTLAEQIAKFDTLSDLTFQKSDITHVGFKKLTPLHQLESLNCIECSFIDRKACESLRQFPHLQRLRFEDYSIDDDCLSHLAQIPALRELQLGNTRITAAGIEHLIASPRLRELSIWGTRFDDAFIAQIAKLKQVRIMRLNSNPLSPATITALRKALPDCVIVWDLGISIPDGSVAAR